MLFMKPKIRKILGIILKILTFGLKTITENTQDKPEDDHEKKL